MVKEVRAGGEDLLEDDLASETFIDCVDSIQSSGLGSRNRSVDFNEFGLD